MNEEFKRQLFQDVFTLQLQQVNQLGDNGQKTVQALRMQAILDAFWNSTKDDDELYAVIADKKKANLEESKANAEASIVAHEELLASIDAEVASADVSLAEAEPQK